MYVGQCMAMVFTVCEAVCDVDATLKGLTGMCCDCSGIVTKQNKRGQN